MGAKATRAQILADKAIINLTMITIPIEPATAILHRIFGQLRCNGG